jgi:hypothetical protein
MYSPLVPLCTSRVVCVASFSSVTVAAATDAPLGSLIVPRIRPPVLCAAAEGTAITAASAQNDKERIWP